MNNNEVIKMISAIVMFIKRFTSRPSLTAKLKLFTLEIQKSLAFSLMKSTVSSCSFGKARRCLKLTLNVNVSNLFQQRTREAVRLG